MHVAVETLFVSIHRQMSDFFLFCCLSVELYQHSPFDTCASPSSSRKICLLVCNVPLVENHLQTSSDLTSQCVSYTMTGLGEGNKLVTDLSFSAKLGPRWRWDRFCSSRCNTWRGLSVSHLNLSLGGQKVEFIIFFFNSSHQDTLHGHVTLGVYLRRVEQR